MATKRNRVTPLVGLGIATALGLSACGGGGFDDGGDGEQTSADGTADLTMLIASSGDAETEAVQSAADAWAEESGNTVEVTVAADMTQELAQCFAGGNPPDVFYLDAARFADNAKNGNLYPYGSELADSEDFYASLVDTFTYEDEFYCAPKDFSTLALQINTAAWRKAGLTDDDVPTTWDELTAVSEKLTTTDQVGLGLSTGIDRLGVFVVQDGGWWVSDDAAEPTGGSKEVVDALTYVQDNVDSGNFAFASQLDSGWGGEAFGTEKAAMTIEGNWIRGAVNNDYPDLDYTVAELPEGPAGKGTLLFTQCWGIAADSDAQAQAVELVDYLTTVDQQMAFADAFGVIPSRESAADEYSAAYPDDAPFIDGAEYGRGPIGAAGMEQVIGDLNSKLEDLGGADIPGVMEEYDSNAGAVLGK
ncbi:MAG: sugar ABC transporter substrate-binding protein [Nocardioides sp.]